jgi:hypothetical protein
MATIGEPFIGTEAVATGRFSPRTLASRNTLIYSNVYIPADATLTPVDRAVAAWLWSGRTATVAGRSAAALLGDEWVEADEPAELTRTQASANDIVIHRERLLQGEVCEVRGMPTTSPARTAYDLGRRPSLRRAVANVDALANATRLTAPEVSSVLRQHKGARGIIQLRTVVDLMDGGAESPQETHTRLVLIDAGMQRPVTQIEEWDSWGHVFARIDMGWPEFKVGVEYDGPQHWTDPARRNRDIDRYAELADQGWILIRVNADLLYRRPWVIVERTVAALRERGCPWLASVAFRHGSHEKTWW